MEKISFDEFIDNIENGEFVDVECICPECNKDHITKTMGRYLKKKKYPLYSIFKEAKNNGTKVSATCGKCNLAKQKREN